MARKKKVEQPAPDMPDTEWSGIPEESDPSPQPEEFEDFDARMKAKDVEDAKAERRPMGGMEKVKWSGIPMWRCPRCRGTTFEESEAKVHTCRTPKSVHEAD